MTTRKWPKGLTMQNNLSPERRKFLKLKEVSEQELMKSLDIDWKTEKRVWVDLGSCYTYNTERPDFLATWDAAKATNDIGEAVVLFGTCAILAGDSGIPKAEVMAWCDGQMNRWRAEREWLKRN